MFDASNSKSKRLQEVHSEPELTVHPIYSIIFRAGRCEVSTQTAFLLTVSLPPQNMNSALQYLNINDLDDAVVNF